MRELINSRFPVYARYCVLATMFATPVAFTTVTSDVFNLTKMTAFFVFGLLAASLWLISAVERGVWPPRVWALVPLVGYLVASTVATVFSVSPTVSIIGMYHRYGGLASIFLYATVFVAIVGLYWERPEALSRVLRASAAATILVAAYVLIQKAGLDWKVWRETGGGRPGSPFGTMGNSNFGGGYLAIGAPVLLCVSLLAQKGWRRRALLGALGLTLLALWFTHSRGAMIAVAVGFAVMGFAHRERLPGWFKIASVSASGVVAVLAVIVVFHPGMNRPPEPLTEVGVLGTGTLEARRFFWGAAWRMFLDRPLVGVGPDAYYAAYPPNRSADDGAKLGLRLADKPHNIFLESLATTGLLGLISFVGLVGLTLWQGYKGSRRLQAPARLLCTGLLGGLAAYVAQGFFSIDVPPLASSGWILMAGIVATADPSAARSRAALEALVAQKKRGKRSKLAVLAAPNRIGPLRWPVHLLVSMAMVFLLVFSLRFFGADARIKQGVRTKGANYQKIQADYQAGIRLNPWEAAYRTQMGRIAESRVDRKAPRQTYERHIRLAISHYKEALRLQPGNVFTMTTVARVYTRWAVEKDSAQFQEAERWWKRIIAHDPTDFEIRRRYAEMLDSLGRKTKDDAVRRRAADLMERTAEMTRSKSQDRIWVATARILIALKEPSESERAKAKAILEQVLQRDPDNAGAKELLAKLP